MAIPIYIYICKTTKSLATSEMGHELSVGYLCWMICPLWCCIFDRYCSSHFALRPGNIVMQLAWVSLWMLPALWNGSNPFTGLKQWPRSSSFNPANKRDGTQCTHCIRYAMYFISERIWMSTIFNNTGYSLCLHIYINGQYVKIAGL